MNWSVLISGCETKHESIQNGESVPPTATKYNDKKHVEDAVLDMEERVSKQFACCL
jgi:hypothetical protein